GGVAERPRERDVRPRGAARVGELEDPLGPRVEGAVDGMAEAGELAAGGADAVGDLACDRGRIAAFGRLLARLDEQPRALLGRAEDDRPAPEDPRGHRP